jgi:O-antigen ligase
MWGNLLKKGFIIYICLTPIEYGLLLFGDSLLKYYGYLLMLIWLIPLKGKVPILKKTPEILFLLIYIIWGLISLMWSKDSEMGSYYILAMSNMIVLIGIASTLSWNNKDVDFLLLAFQISAAAFSILLISQKQLYHGVVRSTLIVNGQEQDPNNFSALLVIPTLISLWKILNKKNILLFRRKVSILNYLCLGLNITAMLILSSRGGLLALLCGTLFLVFFNNKFSLSSRAKPNKLLVLKILILMITFLVLLLPYLDPDTIQRLSTERIQEDKGSDRLLIWETAIGQFNTAPLSGIGIGSFQGITRMGLHNQFIIVLVESGIFGLILFSSSLLILLKKALKSITSLLPAILIGTFVVIFFLDAYNKKYFWNAILISMIILKMEKNTAKKFKKLTEV